MSEPMMDENLERMIARRLDGELTPSEDEAFSRELLREPEARRRMEEYAAADRLAGEALRAAFDRPGGEGVPSALWAVRRSGRHGVAWRVALAAAAGALIAATAWPTLTSLARREAGRSAAKGPGLAPPGGSEAPEPWGAAGGDLPALIQRAWAIAAEPPPAAARPGVRPPATDTFEPLPHIQGPRRGVRTIDRHFLGVFDEQGNRLDLLEFDRIRTRMHAVGIDL